MTKNDFSVLALFLFPLYYLGKFKESTQFEEKYKWELNASTKIEETSEENEIAKANSHHHGRIQPAGKKILKNKQHIFARGIKKQMKKRKKQTCRDSHSIHKILSNRTWNTKSHKFNQINASIISTAKDKKTLAWFKCKWGANAQKTSQEAFNYISLTDCFTKWRIT